MTGGKTRIALVAAAAILCSGQVGPGGWPIHFAADRKPRASLVRGSQLPLLLSYGGRTSNDCAVIQIPVVAILPVPEQIAMTWSLPCRAELGISGRGVLTFKMNAVSLQYEGVFVRGFIDGDARVTMTRAGVPTTFVVRFDGGCIDGSQNSGCSPFEYPYPGYFAANSLGERPGERSHTITAAQVAQATANCASVLQADHSDDLYAETARSNAIRPDREDKAAYLQSTIDRYQKDLDRYPNNSRVSYSQCLARVRLQQVSAEDADDRAWEQQMISQAGGRTGTFGPITPYVPQTATAINPGAAVPVPVKSIPASGGAAGPVSTGFGTAVADPRRALGGVSLSGPDQTGVSTVKSPKIYDTPQAFAKAIARGEARMPPGMVIRNGIVVSATSPAASAPRSSSVIAQDEAMMDSARAAAARSGAAPGGVASGGVASGKCTGTPDQEFTALNADISAIKSAHPQLGTAAGARATSQWTYAFSLAGLDKVERRRACLGKYYEPNRSALVGARDSAKAGCEALSSAGGACPSTFP